MQNYFRPMIVDASHACLTGPLGILQTAFVPILICCGQPEALAEQSHRAHFAVYSRVASKQKGRPLRDGPSVYCRLIRLRRLLALGALPVDEIAERGAARRGRGGGAGTGAALGRTLALLVALDLGAAGFFADSADAETHLLLFLVHLDDLELVLRVHIELDRLVARIDRFGDVAETFKPSAISTKAPNWAVRRILPLMTSP